jgi:PGF-CTERM protein
MKRLKIFILIGLVLIGTAGIVNAQQTLPDGGNGFDNAVEIDPGRYMTGHSIPADAPEYFKLTEKVNAGQLLTIRVINPVVENLTIISNAKLYDIDRAILLPEYDNPLKNVVGAAESRSHLWLPGSQESSYIYYLSVGGGGILDTVTGTEYVITIDDNFDAGSQTDAGDTFETAMEITQGTHKGYLSGSQGTDTKDLYRMSVEAGTSLTVKLTPPSDRMREFTLYDEDRTEIAAEYPSNPGAIAKTIQEITYSGDIYIGITSYDDDYGEYTLDLEIITETGIAGGEGLEVIEGKEEGELLEGVGELAEDEGELPEDGSGLPEAEGELPEAEGELPEDKGKLPGFEVVFTVAGLLSVAFLLRRK